MEDEGGTFQAVMEIPAGEGPFPGLLLSHGLGGSGGQIMRSMGRRMVARGYACIAPDYTHARREGRWEEFGASGANIRRAQKCLERLRARKEVDGARVFAAGNSMGAFLTIGLAAADPDAVCAAAVTAGGIVEVPGTPAPSRAAAERIRVPFLILHGGADTTVPPERSEMLEEVLRAAGVPCERRVYPEAGHILLGVPGLEEMLDAWFQKHAAEAGAAQR